MATDRQQLVLAYLGSLVRSYDQLAEEKTELQAAAIRIPVINALQADLITEATPALARYNTLAGTNLTLQDIRKMFQPIGAQ